MFNIQALYTRLCTLSASRHYLIAYSGGLDSHVLLHALAALRQAHPEIKIRAAHINHGLSVNAKEWAKHCRKQCANLKIPIKLHNLELHLKSGESIEAQARTARYAVLSEMLHVDECLLTAHMRDDQAETVLLQMLRGAGPKGLSAMPKCKVFAKGEHLRPLLDFTREQLEHYAKQQSLRWVEDESNVSLQFDRNFIRHEVLPVLHKRWPAVLNNISRVATNCAEAARLLADLAQQDLATVAVQNECALQVDKLLMLSVERQRNVIRHFIHQQGIPLLDAVKLKELQNNLLGARKDAKPCVRWANVEARRFQNHLYLMYTLVKHDTDVVTPWNFTKPLLLPVGKLMVKKVKGKGITTAIDTSKISIRYRQGGEKLRPAGRKETHTLKKLFQDWGVPPWVRDRIPLVYHEEELIAVVGYCVAHNFAVNQNVTGYNIELHSV